jgi:dihydroorotate dehydrogenase
MIADLLLKYQIDGVIATNTTIGREGVEGLPHAEETGGLSGAPVRQKSNTVIKQLSLALQ